MSSILIFRRKFFPLFSLQLFSALNDNLLKNAVLIIITFDSIHTSIIPKEQLATLASFLFVLPFFLFSSYAGKLADTYNKRTIVQIIKWAELVIMLISAIGIYQDSYLILLLMIFAMGIHAAFFGPIKYSWLPRLVNNSKELFDANGYVELGTFIAILYGQMLGVFLSAGHYSLYLVVCLIVIAIIGLVLSYLLPNSETSEERLVLHKNFIKDSYVMYKAVTQDLAIKLNLHAISWFWLLGVVYLTDLPVFTLRYMGADANTYGVMVSFFSFSIGIGSLLAAKIAKGVLKPNYVLFSGVAMSLFTFALLLLHTHEQHANIVPTTLLHMLSSYRFYLSLAFITGVGLSAGCYSVTCYNEMQVISPDNIRSQIVSANNILNSLYMVLGTVLSSVLLLYFSLWQFLCLLMWFNIFYVVNWIRIKRHSTSHDVI